MSKTYVCEKCGRKLEEMGPFADHKPEGAPAQRWDGTRVYNCVNFDCELAGIATEIKKED